MALLDEQPYVGYPQMGRRRAMPNTDVQMNQGLLRGASYYPYDLLGSPVDLINMALTPIGLGTEKPVMGSAYLQSLAQRAGLSAQPTGSNSENIARLVASLTNPAAGARAAGRVVEPAVQALAPKAGQALESYMVNQGMIQPIMTYHASPYQFSKFDPTKVGTGEGAQSYGVGAGYVAQNPRVANEYFKQFTDVEQIPLMYKGKRVDTPWNNEISQRWADVIEKNKFNQEQIEDFQGVLGNLSQVNTMQDVPNVLRGLSKPQLAIYNKYVKPELTKPDKLEAYMYKVDVKDEVLPNMLDWDKPLVQQTPQVQEALKKLGISTDAKLLAEYDNALLKALSTNDDVKLPKEPINPTGSDIYQRLVQGSPEATSAKLKESGITGIKYLDAFSRKDAPNQTYNYVPFDPEDMNILETTRGLLGE
jgi:hypothetical protein